MRPAHITQQLLSLARLTPSYKLRHSTLTPDKKQQPLTPSSLLRIYASLHYPTPPSQTHTDLPTFKCTPHREIYPPPRTLPPLYLFLLLQNIRLVFRDHHLQAPRTFNSLPVGPGDRVESASEKRDPHTPYINPFFPHSERHPANFGSPRDHHLQAARTFCS